MLWSPAARFLFAATLLAALSGVFGAHAEARVRGDMEIAGGPAHSPRLPAPTPSPAVPPEEPYVYRCQAELNDYFEMRGRTREYQGRRVPYDLWAVAEFMLDSKRPAVSSEDLDWEWIAAVKEPSAPRGVVEIPLKAKPEDAFPTDGHQIFLLVGPGNPREPSTIALAGLVNLPAGDFYHQERALARVVDTQSYIYFQKDVQLFRRTPAKEGEPKQLWRRLYVGCTKER